MTLTRLSLSNPVAVTVGGLLLTLFGLISLSRLPIQLTPEVERPRIFINTGWPGSAPREVESEILEPQEDVLRGLSGLERMEASASRGRASITLELATDIDLDRALLDVMNRLNQVPSYPPDTDEPRIDTGGRGFEGAIAWFALRAAPDNDRPIASYQDFIEEVVLPRIERVPGMASANAFGGREHEIRVSFDPYRMAALGVEIPMLAQRLRGNDDVSAGFREVGRREYTLRFAGKFDVEHLKDLVVDWRDGRPVHLSDLATVERTMVDATGVLAQNGGPSIAMNAIPEAGVNVLRVMGDLKTAVAELRDGPLANAGLVIDQVYDESQYINGSVDMVRNNLILGICLAVGVLWWFLRKFRATAMVALAIPLCLLAAFIGLDITGRTLNTISLAGLAFAVGMVLDAAIVTLENIVRLRERGESGHDAALTGTTQVWGALLASTTTTVAIFLPVVFLRDVAGQLFADLALTIAIAIVASLAVAVTVLPTAAMVWLRHTRLVDPHAVWWRRAGELVMRLTETPARRRAWIAALLIVPVAGAIFLRPQADYLPTGQQNLARAFIQPPPGIGVETAKRELIDVVNQRLAPYLSGEQSPAVESYWLGVFRQGGFMGVRAEDSGEMPQVIETLNREILSGLPDTRAFASRQSVFGRFDGGRVIDVDLKSGDIDLLIAAGRIGRDRIPEDLPGAQVRAMPGVELAEPELRLLPDDRRIAEAGWTRSDMATVLRALGDGAYVTDYFDGDQRLDIVLRGQAWTTPEDFAALPVATPDAGIQRVGSLSPPVRTAGPSQIRRVDRRRTITLRVTPPPDVSLQSAIETLRAETIPAIRDALPADGLIGLSGSADKLAGALASMSSSFALAIVVLYLLISAMFRSFKDSLLVIMTIPLATVGGVIALRVANLAVFQPMDLLTMIGFIIVLGLVVNNAILLVHQARSGEREGLNRREAVEQAVQLRLRPILMSTLTSLFGMLPLLLVPGAGTELYRGMAAVIVGGMSVSALFTLVLLPSLLRTGEERAPAATAV